MKKELVIPLLKFENNRPLLTDVSTELEKKGVLTTLCEVNWTAFPYKPDVLLYSGYTENEILLKYRVTEEYVSALYTHPNDPVYKDSCVEFFISSGNGFYYNLEFNCTGTVFTGYGTGRENRAVLSSRKAAGIRTYSTLGTEPFEVRKTDKPWELTLAIPFTVFQEEEFMHPADHCFMANFYKCGDDLPVPHYLSWHPVETESPDFHRPEFFGKIRFSR